jgi:hypothetical protein
MSDENLTTICADELVTATGGGFVSRAWNVVKETFGYGGPAGASEAASAIPAAKDAALIVPQARARNELIKTLSDPTSNNHQVDKAFDKYHNGPGQKLLKHVGE